MTFLHLHCHSDRTIGRSLIKPSALVEHYSKNDINAACITDNGNMSAAVQLFNSCKKKSMKPIIGMEVNVVDDMSLKNQSYSTIVLLARDHVGFYNLVRIATVGSMYFYYVPRVDHTVLEKYCQGLICLSSDLRGVAATKFFEKGINGLTDVYDKYYQLFDGEFYWEIQPTQTESQRVYNEALLEMAIGFDTFKLVASGDPHYLNKDDRELHEKWLRSKNFRNPSYDYPFRGDFHVATETEVVDSFSMLHGYNIIEKDEFCIALEQYKKIVSKIENFDLRQGVKIPTFAK